MMKRFLLIACLLTSFIIGHAQQNYDVSLIPKELLPYASSVIRDDQLNIEVEDAGNTIEHRKTVITVLNKNGDDDALLYLDYDKATIIKSVKGIIYNEFGKQIAKFSESDFEEQSAWDGFSLFLGDKIKYYRPEVTEYPYTIVYNYEIRLKQSLEFPEWRPVPGLGVAVEKSLFTFSCKPGFNIRYKEVNLPGNVNIINGPDGLKKYTWAVTNLKARKYEPYSPNSNSYLTSVQVSPEKFTYYGLEGSFTNWKELGKWIYDKLLSNRRDLPQETVQHIRDITKDISDPKLKAKRIYEYMQNKTHYISVQVGIGGIQPFPASDVDAQNYGDCKALVNYTQALLKAVNIDSYYCIVEAGRQYNVSLLSDFPSIGQGNHIILCLPFKNDTTWADCTSQTIPFGYLGDFTDDRTVLACTPEGGKLMRTPKYSAGDDLESRKVNFVINARGEISGSMNTLFKGADYDDRDELIDESKTDQDKMLQNIYPINNLEIEHYDLKQDKSYDPSTTENIKLQAKDYASLTDGKYYFMVNSVDRKEDVPKQVTNRSNDVYITRGYTNTDEITYTIPNGYRLEKEPLNVSDVKPFGKFNATMELKGDQLIYKRKLQLIGGTYSKDTYGELVDFFQDVVDADGYTVSLVKN